MKLSEHLKQWRAERPDEWTMDEFIRKAKLLEKLCDYWFKEPKNKINQESRKKECLFCDSLEDKDGILLHKVDCPYIKYKEIIQDF